MRGIRRGAVLLALFLLTWTVPTGLADAQALPPCDEVTEEVTEFENHYVRTADETVEVWEEDNELDDLQTEECYIGENPEDGKTLQPDSLEVELSDGAVEDAVALVPDPVELCQTIMDLVLDGQLCAF